MEIDRKKLETEVAIEREKQKIREEMDAREMSADRRFSKKLTLQLWRGFLIVGILWGSFMVLMYALQEWERSQAWR